MLGLERPPRWGIITLVALVVVNAALLTYLALRPAPEDPFAGRSAPAGQASEVSPDTPSDGAASPAPASTEEPPVLAVYGDGYSTGSDLGGRGAAGWPALVAERSGADLQLNAVSMAGFARAGVTGQDFADIAAASPVPEADVTVVFGSRNDLGSSSAAVGAGAAEAFASIRTAAADTELVVVGPAWSSAAVPADLYLLRDAVEDAAIAAGATFVDPLADDWFAAPSGLIAADGISPTDAGHRYLAERIAPAVEQALEATT
ncbi:SGNH/GDSL hydrolase family protein [Blastococcus sp. SYSU DS0973]